MVYDMCIIIMKGAAMAEEIKDLKINIEMTAGEILREARTTGRRKREIPTIAKQLCIREEFLTALEEGDYTALPEVVYILGFARNYAMELGVDPDMIVEKIKKELGVAKNDEGNLVGGTSTMLACVQNLVAWGISLADAIRMATANPADAIGVSDTKGRIDVGLDADLVLLDGALNVKKVWKK